MDYGRQKSGRHPLDAVGDLDEQRRRLTTPLGRACTRTHVDQKAMAGLEIHSELVAVFLKSF